MFANSKVHFFSVLSIATMGVACSPSVDGSEQEKDGATPPTVVICGQTWTTRNLDVATYRNGDPLRR